MSEDDNQYPAFIVMFCDNCGHEEGHDYLVKDTDTSEERIGYARAHVQKYSFWTHQNGMDFCEVCS